MPKLDLDDDNVVLLDVTLEQARSAFDSDDFTLEGFETALDEAQAINFGDPSTTAFLVIRIGGK